MSETESLRKELGLLDVFCIATGAMISSGLFILPGLAHQQAGPAVFVSYLIAGLLALTGMLSQAELISAMPKAGGDYFYVTRAMGPAVGTVNGLITWFSLCMKSVLALVGISEFSKLVLPWDIPGQWYAVLFCLIFLLLNLFGAKKASLLQIILVFGLLAVLTLYVSKGMFEMRLDRLDPFLPGGVTAVFATAGFVFISYGGLLKMASVAEEVRDPGRVLPLGMMLSLLVVVILYMLVVLVTAGVLEAEALDGSLTPISDGAEVIMGRSGKIILSIAAMFAFITTANAGMLSATRYPLALSRDKLFPEFLNKVNRRFGTPHRSIILTAVFMIVMLFFELELLVKVASSVLILTFILSCLSVVVLRESRLQNYRPQFKAPLYPWIQAAGVVGFGVILFQMKKEALVTGSVLAAAGLFVYWFYGRIKESREYALLHLVERITAKELTDNRLETELKEIIRERDDIRADRFDRIIEKSRILDIKEELTCEELFEKAADEMSGPLNMKTGELKRLFIEREKESSTVITPFLAIPHIVIPGEKTFDILLVRSKDGVVFPETEDKIHAVFFLVGSKDERNFHLRTLSSIAQIVQEVRFEERWEKARDINGLRDVVLLGNRKRDTDTFKRPKK